MKDMFVGVNTKFMRLTHKDGSTLKNLAKSMDICYT